MVFLGSLDFPDLDLKTSIDSIDPNTSKISKRNHGIQGGLLLVTRLIAKQKTIIQQVIKADCVAYYRACYQASERFVCLCEPTGSLDRLSKNPVIIISRL